MTGRRIYPNADGFFPDGEIQSGDYWKDPISNWGGKTPNGHRCGLRNHSVTEHEDGTITVSPSIRVSTDNDTEVWHGFLERGVWRSC